MEVLENNKEYVTTREAGDMLGVSLRTVQLWVENGTLKAWKTVGGHRRIDRASVEALLRGRREELHPLTVVMVVDEPTLRLVYREKFAAWDVPVRVVTAADGYRGLLAIGRHRPDLVVADLILPGMDGLRMIEALRAQPELRHTRVVVVCGADEATIEEHGGLPEGVTLMRKPIPFERLESVVREIAEGLEDGYGEV